MDCRALRARNDAWTKVIANPVGVWQSNNDKIHSKADDDSYYIY